MALGNGISLSDPADLTFPDCVHRFVAGDLSAGPIHRRGSQARRNPLLYEPMVLLDDVIETVPFGIASVEPSSPVCFNLTPALAYAGFPSTLITRGHGAPPYNANLKRSFAPMRSRFGDMNAMVSPAESMAR